VEGQEYSDSEVAKSYAISKGVNKNDILIEESSKTTLENLIYAKKLMNENNLKSALIVSDALHMRRAMLMAKDEGIDAYSSPTKTSMFKTTKKRVEFLRNETVEYILYKCYKVVQHFTDINV
ncbi:MAG TPA: multidrug MFS transporter, partial [Erysipelotrichaceae bacterium]|nr:multidrug MFS transporter [Erysipelotrichaceae bacterium]